MEQLSLYTVSNYRDYLNHRIEHSEARGILSRIAETIQCQRSHLSRVISGQLHLTMDQGFRLCRFFDLSEAEENYFLKLLEKERTGDHLFKQKLEKELAQIRKQQENLSKRLKQETLDEISQQQLYYSSWHWSAIHIAVSIDEYQSVDQLSLRLGLPKEQIQECLTQLKEYDLVTQEKGRWKFNRASLHLAKNSPMNSIQHGNWRSRAVLDSQKPETEGVHYTVVQSLSRADFEKVKQLVLKTIDQYSKIALPSKEEELVCFTCDFFKV